MRIEIEAALIADCVERARAGEKPRLPWRHLSATPGAENPIIRGLEMPESWFHMQVGVVNDERPTGKRLYVCNGNSWRAIMPDDALPEAAMLVAEEVTRRLMAPLWEVQA